MLSFSRDVLRTPILRTLGNIVTGDDKQTQHVLEAGVLPVLVKLLGDSKKAVRKEACWALSNIAAGNSTQIQALIDAGVMAPLTSLVRNASDLDVRREAAWTLSNAATSATVNQIKFLVDNGAIPALCSLFSVGDPKMIMVGLEGLHYILRAGKRGSSSIYGDKVEECDGLDDLENLQKHDNEQIYERALAILREFFDDSADDAPLPVAAQPESNKTQFTFSAAPVPAASPFAFGGAGFGNNAAPGGAPVFSFGQSTQNTFTFA